MEKLSLRVVMPPAEIGTVPLPLESGSCCVHLRCLAGASGAHLVLVDDQGRVALRVEVKAAGGEIVEVQVATGDDGDLRVWSRGHRIFTLPQDSLYVPPPPIPPVSPTAGLDLVFVIDGTARSFTMQDKVVVSEPLLNGAWLDHVERLSRFADELAGGAEGSRFSVLAFGDEALSDTEAPDLRTFYVLRPEHEEQRRFEPLERSRLQDALLALESTSGVDPPRRAG